MNAHVKPLKAYAVTETQENTGAIFFARHAIVAAKRGANEFADGELGYIECRRAPWADAYAETGRLPARVAIANGWHFECHGCGVRVDEDWLHENRKPLDGVIGDQWGAVYCCGKCWRRDERMRARRKAEEQAAIETFKEVVRKRFPGVEFADDIDRNGHHAYVTRDRGAWNWQQVIVAFNFPGMKIGPAHLRTVERRYDWKAVGGIYQIGPLKPEYSCCNGDREAFEAYAAATLEKPA